MKRPIVDYSPIRNITMLFLINMSSSFLPDCRSLRIHGRRNRSVFLAKCASAVNMSASFDMRNKKTIHIVHGGLYTEMFCKNFTEKYKIFANITILLKILIKLLWHPIKIASSFYTWLWTASKGKGDEGM